MSLTRGIVVVTSWARARSQALNNLQVSGYATLNLLLLAAMSALSWSTGK